MSIARHHAEWLSLLDISGPFLSLKVLTGAFPQGLDAPDPDVARELRLAYDEWLDAAFGTRSNAELHQAWVEWVLRRVLDMPSEVLVRAPVAANQPSGAETEDDALWKKLTVSVPEYGVTLRPDIVIGEPAPSQQSNSEARTPRMLVVVVPPGQDLEKASTRSAWQASPATRMMTLLRGCGVRLGLLTNGEQWMLVDRPADENVTTGFTSWYARLWLDEPLTLRAFRTLLGAHRFFGVQDKDTLEALLTASADDRQEVTDQLGYQVRHAVELLVQAIDLADQNDGHALLQHVPEEELYEAAISVMMRLVFLLFAEEQNLLLLGDDIYDRNYAVSLLLGTLREAADRQGEEVLERHFDAWARLLATFRAVYGGFRHDRLTMPAYSGGLFNPDRFPFLEGRPKKTTWLDTPASPLKISNRVVLHLLEALQLLRVKIRDGAPMEARRISFRALDIEQIGHVYEGLLDHTAVRAKEPVLGMAGTRDQEPELPLATLEREAQRGEAPFIAYLQEQTGRSASALKKAWSQQPDAFRASLLLGACGNDQALYARVLPFAGLVRDDDYGRPVVIPAGSVYVTAGAERRATGTHYTPRSLTEPIVQHTLEPLVYVGPAEGKPREEWALRPAADLLKLTVCDMAMGSGAFLVQACRYLSERLLEAWALAEGAEDSSRRLITAEGFSTINPDEAIPTDPEERLVFARRLVADRCLYGVDKNPLAVEMAKLSLWLITLAKGQPFSFLDHALRCGDSLLGISDVSQLTHWSLDKGDGAQPRQTSFITRQLEEALDVALRERRKIAGTRVRDARDADLKAGWLATADAAMALVKLGADLLIATALHPAPKRRAELRAEWLARYSLLLDAAEGMRAGRFMIGSQTDTANHTAYAELRREADDLLAGRQPFHWPLEFPEVFIHEVSIHDSGNAVSNFNAGAIEMVTGTPAPAQLARESGGFGAILGNPPFRNGKLITSILGVSYRDYLVSHLALNQRGHADLCAYFFLRVGQLVKSKAHIGLLATNTIAQGDTREVGLDQMTSTKFVITRAIPNRPWPGTAGVNVACVWLWRGQWTGKQYLDDQITSSISSFLTISGNTTGNPQRLPCNADISFIGSYVLGMGFIMEEPQAKSLIADYPRNKEVLQPFINAEDITSHHSQRPSRWVINFFDWPLERASTYTDCFDIVYRLVKPERQRVDKAGDYVLRKPLPERWWQFADKRPSLYRTIQDLKHVIAIPIVSKYLNTVFIETSVVFSSAVCIIASEHHYMIAALQSTIHEEWARTQGSTLETRMRYTPSDCFETFPFPWNEYPGSQIPDPVLETLGKQYHTHRQNVMQNRQEGLTKTYNRFHSPQERAEDIAELRRLHVEMDQAVAAAYGWTDLDLGHGFHQTKQGLRYTISEPARRTVLDRLLALNHERYAEEVAAGLHDKKKGSRVRGQGSGVRGQGAVAQAPQGARAKQHTESSTPQSTSQLSFDLDEIDSSRTQHSAAPEVPNPEPRTLNPTPYARLKDLLAQRGALTNGDVQAALGVEAEEARALLRRLVEEGLAAVEGQKRGTRYVRRG